MIVVSKACKENMDEGCSGKVGFLVEEETSKQSQRINKRKDILGRRKEH